LWGFICSGKFTPEISYRSVTPALFFTTAVTWVLAPAAMLGALPLARRFRLYWAEIPGHVRERALGGRVAAWESGGGAAETDAEAAAEGLPLRMFIFAPFIVFVLLMVGITAYVALRSAEVDANRLATRLHEEISERISLRLDDYLGREQASGAAVLGEEISRMLSALPIAHHGRALVIDRTARVIASSSTPADPVVT